VSLLFERGAFSPSDSAAVTELTRLLVPSIPFVAAVPLLVPGIRGATARRGVALIATALVSHLLVTIYTYQTADARALAVSFDVAYAAIFVGFYALAKPSPGRR
jgi:peptidoglycan biosynthesis protein MviN/MurJ (putative lipid II flippase)